MVRARMAYDVFPVCSPKNYWYLAGNKGPIKSVLEFPTKHLQENA